MIRLGITRITLFDALGHEGSETYRIRLIDHDGDEIQVAEGSTIPGAYRALVLALAEDLLKAKSDLKEHRDPLSP